jgi:hypothetical protein
LKKKNTFILPSAHPKRKRSTKFWKILANLSLQHKLQVNQKNHSQQTKKILPTIIPENQGGFIKGRHIVDNNILVQEALHSSIQRKYKGMIIKLDLANVFDRFRHNFLFKVMEKFGFSLAFINWIKSCIGPPGLPL